MSLKKKLDRYRQHLKTNINTSDSNNQMKSVESLNEVKSRYDAHHQKLLEVATKLGAKPAYFEEQMIFIKESNYALDHVHGHYRFSEIADVVLSWQKTSVSHPLSTKGLNPSDLLFFDTETTGLGSGTGHMIFLLGCARITDKQVQVKQYFLPGPGHEVALYHHFLKDVGDLKNLVTFNGKAFDWPRVKTRHTLIREALPKLPSFGHYDLLHASRRLWKHSLPTTSLNTIENDILGVPRNEDVPGSMAPFLYFQFQKQPHDALMEGIIKHNEEDILTLVTLYIHLSHLVLGSMPTTEHEHYEVARWYFSIKEYDTAIRLFEDACKRSSDYAIKSKKQLVYLYKKVKAYQKVITIIESLLLEDNVAEPDILIEAAKIYEHHLKDLEKALYYSAKAYDIYEQRKLRGVDVDQQQQLITKRIMRLKSKQKSF